ncbi:MAG: tetratricopeptide repeat protein [Planctomycetaceae bacterium]|nr:tetratricopeptide repeat protein [Planctomycetaceae bacterium]
MKQSTSARTAVTLAGVAMALCALCTAGCPSNHTASQDEAKQKAQGRWNTVRAEMLCGVAADNLRGGRLDAAQAKAAEALAMDPNSIAALLVTGRIALERGQYAQALKSFEQARKIDPKNAQAAYYQAVGLEKSNRLDEALQSYRQAYFLNDTSLDGVKGAAEVMVAMGHAPQARAYLSGFMVRSDGDAGMRELAGRVAMLCGEYAEAAKHFAKARDIDSGNMFYVEKLIEAQFLAGQYHEALASMRDLKASDRYSPPASIYVIQGDCCLAMNRPNDALAAFTTATTVNARLWAAWAGMSRVELALSRPAQAVEAARKAYELDKDNPDSTLLVGYSLIRAGRTAEAVACLKQALARGNDPTLLCVMGRAYAAGGDELEATRCYTAALRCEPGNRLASELLSSMARKAKTETR